jgi:DNA-binding response OmpR family regulator
MGNMFMKKIAVVSDKENMVKELRLALKLQRYEVQANLLREYHLPDAEHLPDLILLDVYHDTEQ